MKRCLITYETFEGQGDYSIGGLRLLDRNLRSLSALGYTAEEQRQEALSRAGKMSIQGVQLKLSAVLAIKAGAFEIVDRNGRFILSRLAMISRNCRRTKISPCAWRRLSEFRCHCMVLSVLAINPLLISSNASTERGESACLWKTSRSSPEQAAKQNMNHRWRRLLRQWTAFAPFRPLSG